MAVFEKKKVTKVTLDDTVPLACFVDAAQSLKDHTEYIMRIQRGVITEHSWQLTKRFNDFVTLDSDLRISGIELPLPPKKVFGNMEREFVADRQKGLQQYLATLNSRLLLTASIFVKRFLDPTNYSVNLPEVGLQHVSMIFRSEPRWEVVEPLHDLGWRLRKHYFLIKPLDQPKTKLLLSWSEYGPDKFLPAKEMSVMFETLTTIQHSNIFPVKHAIANENGGMVIQDFHELGTLRDYICHCKPKGHYLKKYAKPKTVTIINITELKMFGKQILDLLKFLQEKGLPYCHLHAGNIILQGKTCMILNLENWLLGLPSLYRPYFTQFRKIQSLELIDVYCFGHLLYEMTFGMILESPTCDIFPPTCPPQLRSVLESILTTEACKNGLPSLADLLLHPFFADVPSPMMEKPVLKIRSKVKEAIRVAKDDMERRLKEELKIIHQVKRISKAKEFHMSEEEKQKRRKSKKKTMENANDKPSSPAPPAENGSAVQSPTSPTSPAQTPSTANGSAVPPPPPAVPPPAPTTAVSTGVDPPQGRGALLGSISNFSKKGLKKTISADKSAPKI